MCPPSTEVAQISSQQVLAQAAQQLLDSVRENGAEPSPFAVALLELMEHSFKLQEYENMMTVANQEAKSDEAKTWQQVSLMTLQYCQKNLVEQQQRALLKVTQLVDQGESLFLLKENTPTLPDDEPDEEKTRTLQDDSTKDTPTKRVPPSMPPPAAPTTNAQGPSEPPPAAPTGNTQGRAPPPLTPPGVWITRPPPGLEAPPGLEPPANPTMDETKKECVAHGARLQLRRKPSSRRRRRHGKLYPHLGSTSMHSLTRMTSEHSCDRRLETSQQMHF